MAASSYSITIKEEQTSRQANAEVDIQSGLNEDHLDPETAQNREAWRMTIMTIDSGQRYERQR